MEFYNSKELKLYIIMVTAAIILSSMYPGNGPTPFTPFFQRNSNNEDEDYAVITGQVEGIIFLIDLGPFDESQKAKMILRISNLVDSLYNNIIKTMPLALKEKLKPYILTVKDELKMGRLNNVKKIMFEIQYQINK